MSLILGAETVTLRRFASATRNSYGETVDGAATDSSILMGVQPLSGKELQTLALGERSSEYLKGYTETAVRTGDQNTGAVADHIVVDSIVYEVRQVERQRSILPHYKVTMVKVWPR